MKTTRTYAELTVPREVWELIWSKLNDAGYDHAIDNDNGVIDMHGLALVVDEKASDGVEELAEGYHNALDERWIKEIGGSSVKWHELPESADVTQLYFGKKELRELFKKAKDRMWQAWLK